MDQAVARPSGSMAADSPLKDLIRQLDPSLMGYNFHPSRGGVPDESRIKEQAANDKNVVAFASRMLRVRNPPTKEELRSKEGEQAEFIPMDALDMMIHAESTARQAFRSFGKLFRTGIWDCCSKFCFAEAILRRNDPVLVEEFWDIHSFAERLHRSVEKASELVKPRKKGIGGTGIAHAALTRRERQQVKARRQEATAELKAFVAKVLPFLRGLSPSPTGTVPPGRKLCSEAICCLLGISRNFLYRKKRARQQNGAEEEDPLALVDVADVRLRQKRRVGSRAGYPELSELRRYDCGCKNTPCLDNVPLWRLLKEYKGFTQCSRGMKHRRMENRYLLNAMYCPLLNSTVAIYDQALAALFTVSKSVIADVRFVLIQMCRDGEIDDRAVFSNGVEGYTKNLSHPMNRYDDQIREKIESHLDMVLRTDPAATDGMVTCRVYSPEINTQEKLRRSLAKQMEEDEQSGVHLSASTLQRMIEEYYISCNCRLSLLQSDHIACPTCKTLKYAVLQFSYEVKSLEAQIHAEQLSQDVSVSRDEKLEALKKELAAKRFQEEVTLKDLKSHNTRDMSIRRFLKIFSDHLKVVENSYREVGAHGRCGMEANA